MTLKYIAAIVGSGVNMIVQPVDAEAYEYPAAIAKECQDLANEINKPVRLLGKNSDKVEFTPAGKTVIKPIEFVLSRHGDGFKATLNGTNCWDYGKTEADAIAQLVISVAARGQMNLTREYPLPIHK